MSLKPKLLFLSACALVSILLAACGGSGSTIAPGPGPGPGAAFTARIPLGGTTLGNLSIDVSGATATGSITSSAPSTPARPPLPAGNYPLTGTFTAPSTFSLTGTAPGIGQISVTGTMPTADTPGSYELKLGADTSNGGFLPTGAVKPELVMKPPILAMDPGQRGGIDVDPKNFPAGKITYRWFIAAPSAYFVTDVTPPTQGQDITVENDNLKVQTSVADKGKLKAYVHAYHESATGVKTFLAETFCSVELTDIQFLEPKWVTETGTNPLGAVTYTSYCYEFPIVPGAKFYLVSTYNHLTGQERLRHRILPVDIEAVGPSSVPIYFGAVPHSFPPTIFSREEITGSPRYNFFQRSNSIRFLIETTDSPASAELTRTQTPTSVKVYF